MAGRAITGEGPHEVQLEPSLYAADFARLGEQIGELLHAGARTFHFDVGDGRFVEPVTMGPIVLESIAPLIHAAGGLVDCHLMVADPGHHIPQLVAAGGDSVTFHVEAVPDPKRAAATARELGAGVGLAVNPDTPVERAAEAAREASVDFVLCMSIHPGYSGQRFMPESIERIGALRELLPADVPVQVDGGIDFGSIERVAAAGASMIVSGSAIFGSPAIGAAFQRLHAEATQAAAGRAGAGRPAGRAERA